MNQDDQQLREALGRLKEPPPKTGAPERALARALMARSAARSGDHGQSRSRFHLRVAAACATCLLVLGAIFLIKPTAPARTESSPHLFSEIQKLFPDQVIAVVKDDEKVDLRLADLPTPGSDPEDQAVLVSLVKDSHRVQVYTYSGRQVCLNLDGNKVCLTPLQTGSGDWILVSEHEVVPMTAKAQLDGYAVTAEGLAKAQS